MAEQGKFKLLVFEEVVDPLLNFKNPLQELEYNMFCEDRISMKVTTSVLFLYTLYFIFEILSYPRHEIFASCTLMLTSTIFVLLVPIGTHYICSEKKQMDRKRRYQQEMIMRIMICGACGMFCAIGDVSRTKFGHFVIILSPEAVVWLISPLLLLIVFHSTDWLGAFFCIFSGIACMSVPNWNNFSYISVSSVFFYMTMCSCVCYEYRRQSISKFLLNQNLILALRENERMAQETHATEMRHMIANVAHDLKTPLAGFVHVNEIVSNIVTDCEEKYQNKTLSLEEFYDYIQSLRSCVKTTQSINTFMLMTINRCIDYTKASQGLKLVPYYGTVNLAESLSLPLTVMRDIQSKINIRLNDISGEVCTHIITDYQWIQENVLCLLSNAIKYSSGGEVTINIELRDRENVLQMVRRYENGSASQVSASLRKTESTDGDKLTGEAITSQLLLVEIEDTGIGLSEEDMLNLFNPFKQAQRLTGGTGLGLYSLAKRLEALGGFYGVQKRRDGSKGSRFWFAVPYRPDVCSAEEALRPSASSFTPFPLKISPPWSVASGGTSRSNNSTSAASSADHPSPIGGSSAAATGGVTGGQLPPLPPRDDSPVCMHVLVVDDSMPILKLTCMLLKRNGHTTVQVENGSDAVDALLNTEQAFDVVLMDLQMPVMDGFEATRRIRARELETEQTRLASKVLMVNVSKTRPVHQTIIGMSANSDSDTINEAFAAGMDAFMAKPFQLKTFYEKVQKMGKPSGVLGTPSSAHPENLMYKPNTA